MSITLSHASQQAPWVAIDLVISKPEHRHRITFKNERPLHEIFCPAISDRILQVLGEFRGSDSDAVFTNPDEEIALPGLSLRQLRVIYSHQAGQPARAQVRFATVIGNPHRALNSEDGFSFPLEALTSQLYRDALDWVLIPAVNLAAVDAVADLSVSHAAQVDAALQNLRNAKEQLLFQIELVKRELNRLESRSYFDQLENRPLLAAEPQQEAFRSLTALRKLTE
ncbi:hypothetical protein HKCCE4037_00385 [Rhodobacterales bacterium HKCCE4037]|nr:hypothetical protein [Rhodobacterales bacterium HKCCE4037]